MKLAEALRERADLNRKLKQLSNRLEQNALVQEGENPAENPVELLAEFDGCIARLEELAAQINLVNCRTLVEGRTLTELLARRDCLKMRVKTYHDFLMAASSLTQRGMRTEIKVFSTVPVPEYRKKADALSRQLRETDNAIQAANWTTELL